MTGERPLGLWMATALVIGSMIGSSDLPTDGLSASDGGSAISAALSAGT